MINERKSSILIVDNDEEFIESVKAALLEKNYKTFVALTIDGAMAKLRNQRFDCILLDLHLDKASGEVIVENLRSNAINPNTKTPIIFISGFLEADVVLRNLSKVQGMLVKPFTTDDLDLKIQTALKK